MYGRLIIDWNGCTNRVTVSSSGLYQLGGTDLTSVFSTSDKRKFVKAVRAASKAFINTYNRQVIQEVLVI